MMINDGKRRSRFVKIMFRQGNACFGTKKRILIHMLMIHIVFTFKKAAKLATKKQ